MEGDLCWAIGPNTLRIKKVVKENEYNLLVIYDVPDVFIFCIATFTDVNKEQMDMSV